MISKILCMLCASLGVLSTVSAAPDGEKSIKKPNSTGIASENPDVTISIVSDTNSNIQDKRDNIKDERNDIQDKRKYAGSAGTPSNGNGGLPEELEEEK